MCVTAELRPMNPVWKSYVKALYEVKHVCMISMALKIKDNTDKMPLTGVLLHAG